MQENIIEFMDKIKILDKNLSQYIDKEKGVMFFVNTVNLLTRVDYLEVSTKTDPKKRIAEYELLKFEKKIEDLDYKKITKKEVRVKSDITGRKEDMTTLLEDEVPAVAVWNVSNSVGVKKSFINKDEAIKFSDKINSKILNYLK